ncbi:MAG: SdrD B-like domain-containing protein [Anaerolineales bacterium]
MTKLNTNRKLILIFLFLFTACSNPQSIQATATETRAPTVITTFTPIPSVTSTPQPRLAPNNYGPEANDFPAGINPLTGRAVEDPSLLDFPAVLVSISNMPVSARPQAGPGFAPWIFELYIGEGTTRFMGVFYGDVPRVIPNVKGGCKVRDEIMRPKGDWIGNRVWLDENENGQQDAWEAGVGGVCVNLLDAVSSEVLAETSTDSNGYYAFDRPDVEIILQFIKPASYEFTKQNVKDEDRDSDADIATGATQAIQTNSTVSFWDAGLILAEEPIATSRPVVTGTPPNWYIPSEPYIGPIRSGRLTYNQIGRMFPNSCLVYASAATDIGERLDKCEIIFGVDRTTPNSALLTVTRLRELAEESLNPVQDVNYSGNYFSDSLPNGGETAIAINIYYHLYSQTGWQYDPISNSYLRYTDRADASGELIPATERLTGRQLAFENVIVVFAEHGIFRPNQFDIDLSQGQKRSAYLFRDGQAFKIYWSTANREWEKTAGLLRPIHFVDAQDNLISLRPGRTWTHLVSPFSAVTEQGDGQWLVRFVEP